MHDIKMLKSGMPSMQEVTDEKLQIAFIGPAVRNGRMDMLALSSALRGQALLVQRVKQLLFGDSVTIVVEIDPKFEDGSLVVPVHILSDFWDHTAHLLAGENVTAIANLLAILSFGGVTGSTLLGLFKRRKGRKIESPEDIPKDVQMEISIQLLIRIFNDPEVQLQLRKLLEPLRMDGIEEFQTRRHGTTIERVHKSDLSAADEAEIQDNTKDEEITLDIQKVAWRRSLAWHFSDGEKTFDAKIEDENFWKSLENGEAFSDGDKLRVHLHTTARRTEVGTLKVERKIPTVFEVDHVRKRQASLPLDDAER